MPNKNINVGTGVGKIENQYGDIHFHNANASKENFEPSIEWAKEKVGLSLRSIGNRYITYNKKEYEQLNQKIDIQEYFNYLSEKEVAFHDIFTSFIDEMESDDFASFFPRYYEYKKVFNFYKDTPDITYVIESKRKEFTFFKDNHLDLTKFYQSEDIIKTFIEYVSKIENNKKIIFNKKFLNIINELENLIEIAEELSKKIRDLNPTDDYGFRYIETTFKYYYNIYFYPIVHILKYYKFNTSGLHWDINASNQLISYLFKYTLITGEAMSGKTHLLSDIANERVDYNKPTILIYAQKFEGYSTPIQHIIKQLHLEQYQYTDEEFLEVINEWGKKTNELVFLIIDAINETTDKKVWRNNFIEFVSMVKKYPYVALIMSIRDVEKRVVFTKDIENYVQSNMIEIEHVGFKEIEYPVLKKFCKVFEINLPKFPITSPIFANPGLMFLFFETLKRRGIVDINEQVLKPNFIIEEYIKDRNQHFKELNNLSDRRTYIHQGTNIIASKMAPMDFIEKVKYDDIYKDVSEVHQQLLEYLISEGILLEQLTNLDEVYLYFSYQRFGNYFIALYLLSGEITIDNLPHKDIIYNLFSSYHEHQALVEALIIRLSENNRLDFIDIFPELFDNRLNSIRYECFSKSLKLPYTIEYKIHDLLNLDSAEKSDILDLLLHFAYEELSQFNIQKILHPALLSLSMSERDYYWSIYIHNSYREEGIVKRIIHWAWDKKEEFEIEDESLYLYGLTLGWFLTSSNRELRDGATKALVNLFTDRVDVFLRVLREFETVDDLYVLERLYAVGYGIVLRSSSRAGCKELGIYVYETIFNKDEVVEHILIRDYAKLTVEYIHKIFSLGIKIDNIYPPYNQHINWELPTIKKEDVEQYQDDYTDIYWSSLHGDFKIYVVYPKLNHFMNLKIKDRPHPKSEKQRYDEFVDALTPDQKKEYEKIRLKPQEILSILNQANLNEIVKDLKQEKVEVDIQDIVLQTKGDLTEFKKLLSTEQRQEYDDFIINYKQAGRYEKGIDVKSAKKYLFLEVVKMGWRKELFEEFDGSTGSYSRHEHTRERIGKKYQWIAFYQLLAKLTDYYEFREESYGEEINNYRGLYQLSFTRNIDPSSILKQKKNLDDIWWFNIDKSFENSKISNKEWMGSVDKLPTIEQCIKVKKEDEEFLVQSLAFSIDGNKDQQSYRNLYYHIDAFVLQKDSLKEFIEWLKTVDYFGQHKLPQSSSLHDMYLREYPEGESFKYLDTYYHGQMDWDDSFNHIDGVMPTQILLTSTSYMNEASSYDKSVSEAIEIKLPNKWFIQEMNLKQTLNDGEWIDKAGNIVFLNPTVYTGGITSYNDSGILVSNKKLLTEFLKSRGLTQIWIVWGEKQVRSTKDTHDDKEFLGFGEIMGYGYFDGDKFVEEIHIRYEK